MSSLVPAFDTFDTCRRGSGLEVSRDSSQESLSSQEASDVNTSQEEEDFDNPR
jgi:hypothetical protein